MIARIFVAVVVFVMLALTDTALSQTVVSGIAAGTHSLALQSNGTVWAWGSNNSGQFGNGTMSASNVPIQVLGPTGQGSMLQGIMAIAAGGDHSLALKSDGTVWAWGNNSGGQLGNDSLGGSYTTPASVFGFSTPTYACTAGTINSGSGSSTDVLFVNGSPGNVSNIANVGVNMPITLGVAAPPAGPNPSFCMLWAWLGYPTAPTALTAFGQNIGCTANPPSFMPGLLPQPVVTVPFYAPFTISIATGFPTPIVITLQGIQIDLGSATPVPMSITNAVIVNVQ